MIKVLLFGCGRIVYKHIQSIQKLKNKFHITGICDLDEKKVKFFSKKLNVPGFSNIDIALKTVKPDLVSILTPSGLHYQHAMKMINRKINIIIEKPMCLKIKHGEEIQKAAVKNRTKVFVVMQNVFNTPVEKVVDDIKNNKFGKIFHSSVVVKWRRDQKYYNQSKWRGTWQLDGGVISNQASHHIDLMRRIMGEPVEVYAIAKKHLSKIECEDTALVIVNFKGGKTGIIEATTAMRPKDIEGSLSIMGTNGSAKIGGFALNQIDYYNLKRNINLTKYQTNPKNVYGYGHLKFYQHVYKSIKKNLKSEFDANESNKTVKFLNMIYRSIETKGKVSSKGKINSIKLGNIKK